MMTAPFEYKDVAQLRAGFGPGPPIQQPSMHLWLLYDTVLTAFGVPRDGVIHLGAHDGREIPIYVGLGFRRALMVEPQPQEFEVLKRRASTASDFLRAQRAWFGPMAPERTEFRCLQCAVAEQSGTAVFYRTASSVFSSLARPDSSTAEDDGYASTEIQVEVRTLDEIATELGDKWSDGALTYLRMNIQGSELRALKGAEAVLDDLKAISLEVSLEPRYEGQPRKEDFDEFLGARGFNCVFAYGHHPVGELVYCRPRPTHACSSAGFGLEGST